MLTLYNTRTRKKEPFKPVKKGRVGLYTCGPTVYHFAHIGNLRTYIFEDVLKRALQANGYRVRHVMNITDVGHLTDDADAGEDKIEKGARREGKTAAEVAQFYTKAFLADMRALNILPPDVMPRAAARTYIQEQIRLVQTLIEKGHTYQTSDGIYFDTTTFPAYGALARLGKQQLKAGARVDMGEKKHPHDFALWKFTKPGEQRQMEWKAFGKKGFPGWHLECSAMALKLLGTSIDIHCGGVDHIPVHHTNEIAQSEAAAGVHPWVNVWMHGEFLLMGNNKMAKSGDNVITLSTLQEKNITPLAYRFFALQTHYRKQLTFSWKALQAAQSGLVNLYQALARFERPGGKIIGAYQKRFMEAINNDLDTPRSLALMWELIRSSNYTADEKLKTVLAFDEILGLDLQRELKKRTGIPQRVRQRVMQREEARRQKNWQLADRLRSELEQDGYCIEDTQDGPQVRKVG